MMLFSEANGHKIVSTATAETVGRVSSFVVEPKQRRVVALTVRKSDGGDTLHWQDIHSFGQDAVTVDGVERLVAAAPEVDDLAGKQHEIIGKRVLNTDGDEIGKATDVEFDPQTSAVTGIVLDTGPIDGTRLIGVGSYAVVVHAAEHPLAQQPPPQQAAPQGVTA